MVLSRRRAQRLGRFPAVERRRARRGEASLPGRRVTGFLAHHARSDGLQLSNDYNALYAEYLFRAKGDAGDWITYQVPAAIESVKIVAFFAKEIADLTLQVSADGTAFTTVEPRRTERRLPSPPGGAAGGQRRTLVEYEASVPPGQRCLQIRWNGPAELDRVEIYHRL